jgi:phospholipid/cholesterol/gamma-HCH transport system substrate-binding protein
MRRILAITVGLLGVFLAIFLPGAIGSGSGGTYEVRAIFENGAFIVSGEEVRIAGAKVGTVQSVDVSGQNEIVSLQGGPHAVPGKAVVVLNIDNNGFKNFLSDASCIIRPQSLIGERYVDCTPTQPRAPGSQPPPGLQKIASGQPGAGQYLLPLENNATTVDLDLIQNIQRLPYRDRFRLILNELGAGLAARGADLGEIIDQANPALRQTDRVLNILAEQSRQLASLASNGDASLEPLARNRTSVTGFLHNAAIASAATAEKGTALEQGLQKLPETLHQVRLTMGKLKDFADQGSPLFADLKLSGANISKATQDLAPFANAGVPALTTLGNAVQSAGPKLVASDGLLSDLAATGSAAVPVGNNLSALLDTFVKTQGFQNLANFIYFTSGATNGFDAFGHYLRTNVQVTNCIDISAVILQGCEGFFQSTTNPPVQKKKKKKNRKVRSARFRGAPAPQSPQAPPPTTTTTPAPGLDQLVPPLDPGAQTPQGTTTTTPDEALLRFLLGGGS